MRPSPGADLFRWHSQFLAGLAFLSLEESRIAHTNVLEDGRGSAELVLHGAFYAESTGPVPRTERRIGPLSADDARRAAAAIDRALDLPRRPILVTATMLSSDPRSFDGKLVELTSSWTCALETSSMAGAWLQAPAYPEAHGVSERRVVGFFSHREPSGARGPRGFGHFGVWASQIEVVEMFPPAGEPHAR